MRSASLESHPVRRDQSMVNPIFHWVWTRNPTGSDSDSPISCLINIMSISDNAKIQPDPITSLCRVWQVLRQHHGWLHLFSRNVRSREGCDPLAEKCNILCFHKLIGFSDQRVFWRHIVQQLRTNGANGVTACHQRRHSLPVWINTRGQKFSERVYRDQYLLRRYPLYPPMCPQSC
jgi:hypothetical protein